MKEIIAWTAAEPVKTDFTSDKGAFILKNKINKLGVPFISEAKKDGIPITVETCPHYLTLSAEEVPMRATQFKCCPPIRDRANQVVNISI